MLGKEYLLNFRKEKGKNEFVRLAIILFVVVCMVLISKSNAYGASSTKIHIISVKQSTNAILVESNGRFGMIDSGEDNNYPPNPRQGVTIGRGVEDIVKSYLRSQGVNSNNFDFYIGTHAHSDHIGSADQIIREFKPKVVYIPEYKDSYIIAHKDSEVEGEMEHDIKDAGDLDKYDPSAKDVVKSEPYGLWDNQFVYDRMVAAAKEVGATLYTRFDSSNDHFDFGKAKIQLFNTDQDYIRTGVANANEMSLGAKVTSENGISAFVGGDMTNIGGIENKERFKIGKVSLMTTNHHGYWGSNSYGFINTLDPDVMVSTNSRVFLSTVLDPNDNVHTSFNTIVDRIKNGMKIYSTGALYGIKPALVFQLDESLTNNLPSTVYDAIIGYGNGCDTRHRTLRNGQIIDGVTSGIDGDWVDVNGYRRFKFANGQYAFSQALEIDGTTYDFDNHGNIFSGWAPLDGYWVFFGEDGKKVKGWVNDKGSYYYLDDDYHMVTGVVTIEGATYVFKPNGIMSTGWAKTGDHWYYSDKSGKMVKNQWIKSGGNWYYLNDKGIMETGSVSIGGTRYCFKDNGAMIYGWYRDSEDIWYYGKSNGYGVELGWKKIGKVWYYFDDQGRMATGKKNVKGTYYFFLPSGSMKTGWGNDEGTWYYGYSNGSLVNSSWKKINGTWYYFDSRSEMATGKKRVNGSNYFFLTSGAMKTGWAYDNGTWYYARSGGSLVKSSWQKLGSTWYYFDNQNRMAIGNQDIGGITYLFADSGKMVTGWSRIVNNDWNYYLSSGRQLKSAWRKINNKWYYFDNKGIMAKGIVTVDNKDYFFYSSGAMKTGWVKDGETWYYAGKDGSFIQSNWKRINNIWYYFDREGKMVTDSTEINGITYNFRSDGQWIA